MTNISAWRQALPVALVLALLVVMQAGLIAQNLGTAPQVNVAVQGQSGSQPEGTWLNLINWIGNVIRQTPLIPLTPGWPSAAAGIRPSAAPERES